MHPPPSVLPFLLMQNLSPKDIAGSDIISSHISRRSEISERSTWYPTFTHVWLPRKLGNYCYTSLCCYITKSWELPYALGKVGKPGIVLKDKQLMEIQYGKDVLVWVPTATASPLLRGLTVHICAPHKRQKRHTAITDLEAMPLYHGSAWCGRTLQSYISVNISPCNYLLVQLIYLNE